MTLSKLEVYAKIQDAIASRKLAILFPEKLDTLQESSKCWNTYPYKGPEGQTLHCIIGCAVPPEISEGREEFMLEDLPMVIGVTHGEVEELVEWQLVHDLLCNKLAVKATDERRVKERDRLIEIFSQPEPPPLHVMKNFRSRITEP